MKNNVKFVSYSDERIVLLRPLNPINPVDFECIKVYSDPNCVGGMRFLHETIYLSDFNFNDEDCVSYLDELLKGFGYDGLDDFVEQNSPYYCLELDPRTGKPDRVGSPDYIVDMQLLASLILESHDGGILTTPEKADEWVKNLTGDNVEW